MKRKLALALALGFTITYGSTVPAHTYAKSSIEGQLSDVRQYQLDQQNVKDHLLSKQTKAQIQLNQYHQQTLEINAKIDSNQAAINQNKDEVRQLNKEIVIIQKRIDSRQKLLKKRVRAIYENGGTNSSYLDVILGAKSFGDFIDRAIAVYHITSSDNKLIKAQKEDQDVLKKNQNSVHQDLKDNKQKIQDLQNLLANYQNLKDKKQDLVDSLGDKAKNIDKNIINLKETQLPFQEQKIQEAVKQVDARQPNEDYKTSDLQFDVVKNNEEGTSQKAEKQADVLLAGKKDVPSHSDRSQSDSSKKTGDANHSDATQSDLNNNQSSTSDSHSDTAKVPESAATGDVAGIINEAKTYIGHSTYVFGGGRSQSDIEHGRFDCSSFVYYVFRVNGISLGSTTGNTDSLINVGRSVSSSDMKPGDLVFFDTYKKNGHVGIYIGNGQFIACNTSGGVQIKSLKNNPYWSKKFNYTVRRVLG
ncbi:NlpC/P60 family protein [Scopulibacillus cellulosilyticus]|uniref:NlpC/P60 family protein n=1 Tax=Scopulibacillus cellulosilyticus TaxID=2665665 RepID=A0ABW2PSG3_9BACL